MEIFIERFRVTDIQPNAAMHFEAVLTNPRPVGAIHTKGTFGPWQVWDPGQSPIVGDYSFDHANLGDFKGISGYLSSTGNYQGTLRDITVDGQTDTPDFSLPRFGNTMDLQTRFHAIVDGTNGDTWLDPVNATLGHTHITARGQVVRVFAPASAGAPHTVGHDINLKIQVDHGRIEDFLHLATHAATPLLTGDVDLKSTLHIPPGPAPVHERMALKGQFTLDQAQFSSTKVEDRIQELSLRGQGKSKDAKDAKDAKSTGDPGIEAHMQSDFEMAAGVITLPNLAFDVPGADILLKGTYTLSGGGLDFKGLAKMQATVSKMVGGWKGFLLKPADRFFKKDGAGTEVPITWPAPTRIPTSASTSKACRTPIRNAPTSSRRNKLPLRVRRPLRLLPAPPSASQHPETRASHAAHPRPVQRFTAILYNSQLPYNLFGGNLWICFFCFHWALARSFFSLLCSAVSSLSIPPRSPSSPVSASSCASPIPDLTGSPLLRFRRRPGQSAGQPDHPDHGDQDQRQRLRHHPHLRAEPRASREASTTRSTNCPTPSRRSSPMSSKSFSAMSPA